MNGLTAALADALHAWKWGRGVLADGEWPCTHGPEAEHVARTLLADPRTAAALEGAVADIGEEWANAAEWLTGRILAALGEEAGRADD